MRFLALLFFAVIAVAAAVPLPYADHDMGRVIAVEDFFEDLAVYNDQEVKTEIGKLLKDYLNGLLENVKVAVEQGRIVKEDTLNELREVRQKLRDLKIDIGNRAREHLEELKEKAKGYWNQILDVLEGKNDHDWEPQTEIGKRLKKEFDDVLEKFKDAVEKGKAVKEETLEKLKEIRQKLADIKGDISDNAKKVIKNLREKAKDYFHRLLEKLRPSEAEYLAYADDDIKTELGKILRDRFDEIMEKVKEAIEQGKGVKEETLEKLKDIREKLRNLKIDLGDKAKELLDKIKDKAKDYWQKILDKIAGKEKREIIAFGRSKEELQELKEAIEKGIQGEELKQKVVNLVGEGSELTEQILNMLKEPGDNGVNRVLRWINRMLDRDEEEREKKSIKEYFEKIRNYFKDLNIELKDKFAKFGEYVKEKYQNVLEKGKPRVENLKRIANKFVEDTKEISRDVAREALEFFREYKEDLGRVFDNVREKVRDILRKDQE